MEYVYKPTRCTIIIVIRLYFSTYALHVSDCIIPSSGAIFLQAVCRIWYIRILHTACKNIAPEDGLIQSETCRTYIKKIKANHKNFVHLVGLYTYYHNNASPDGMADAPSILVGRQLVFERWITHVDWDEYVICGAVRDLSEGIRRVMFARDWQDV